MNHLKINKDPYVDYKVLKTQVLHYFYNMVNGKLNASLKKIFPAFNNYSKAKAFLIWEFTRVCLQCSMRQYIPEVSLQLIKKK